MLDNVNSETSTSDSIALTKTALHSTDGLEKTAPTIENNQEESMYMDIIDYKPQPISDEPNSNYSTDNEPIYEEVIDTESYYETPRSNSNHPKHTDQKFPIYLAQADKNEAHIYENGSCTNQYEEPIYEEIDSISEPKNNKNEKLSDQNRSPVSKKQVKNIRDIFKTVLKHIT
ncbi:hypothetical protein [Cardinium endosymbiont of Bemisia tabaci]|uniref:hypothetical protein n=1 Tax=Cardinium endosymbiont of Bemisia tabaci TaxID=672794 RepID=UPI000557997E|nr:hypothetical protein [Cardinium endosymbiont of Bemisia tabaci]